MSMATKSVRRLWTWLKAQYVAEVPEDIAVCEFDCRKTQCFYKQWTSCERRLSRSAAALVIPTVRVTSGD